MKSNMYSWVTKTRNFLGGECKHFCKYCYVNSLKNKFPNIKERYSGEIRLLDKELSKNEGKGKTIFVQDMGDLFAENIPKLFIKVILRHLNDYPYNTYLFQTKNPKRYFEFINLFPPSSIFGTTIESNKQEEIDKISKAPKVYSRQFAMGNINFGKVFLTLEPIIDFDLDILVNWIKDIQPDFVNIGADSKNNHLNEPSKEKVLELIKELEKFTEVRIKSNLNRIIQ